MGSNRLSLCAPYLETVHPCPNCLSALSQDPNATLCGSDAHRFFPVAGSPFPQLSPCVNSGVNPRSSNDTSTPPSVNRKRSISQVLGTAAVRCVQPAEFAQHPRGVTHSCKLIHLPQEQYQSCTAAVQSFRISRPPNKRRRIDLYLSERIDENPSTPGFDSQEAESTHLEQPLRVDNDFNGDFEDQLSGSPTWSDVLMSPDDLAEPISEQGGEHRLAQNVYHCTFRETSKSRSESVSDSKELQVALGFIKPCSLNFRTCLIVATKILQAIHVPSSTCLSTRNEATPPKSSHPPMIDSVLSTNREVTRLISDMLRCACSSNSQLQLILTIIFRKLIRSFKAMIRNDNPSNDSSTSTESPAAQSQSRKTDNHQAERVLHLPITIGEYTLDIALENKIRGQIILSELQRLDSLVDRLSNPTQVEKYPDQASPRTPCRSSRSSSTVSSGPPTPAERTRLARTVRSSLQDFLRAQLEAAKAETTSTLIIENS